MTINFPIDVLPGIGLHAGEHLPGGNDPLQLATTAQNGLATAAQVRALLIPTTIKTGAYQAVAGEAVRTDTSGGGFTVTAPTSPADGAQFSLEDAAEGGSWTLANPLLLITGDNSTLAGNSGASGVNHDGGTRAVWRYIAATLDWAYLGEAGGAGTGGGDPGGGTTITAAGDWSPVIGDHGRVIEFSQDLGAQRILLPASTGFARGFAFDVVARADDTLFAGFPLIIEAQAADMRSQNGFADWITNQARLQLGGAKSLYASVSITRIGGTGVERWLVTGDFDKEVVLQAGSLQSLRSEWRVNKLVGSGGNVTAVGSDCSQLDALAGSAMFSLTAATNRPAIAGTADTTNYRLVFDGANQERITGAYSGAPTDDYGFGILFKCDTAYADVGDTILHTGIANNPHLRVRVEGTPPSSLLSVQHVGAGTVFNKVGGDIAGMRDGTWKAMVITHLGTTINVYHTGTGERQTKTATQYGEGHVAADSLRLGDTDATAGTFEVRFLAWWGKAPDAREAVGWMRWALGNAS